MAKPKKNIIKARVQTGKYKDSNFEIEIGKTSDDTIIKCNGKPMDDVFGAHIHMRVGQVTTLVLEKYAGDKNG